MAIPACEAAMQTLNAAFQIPYIFNDGHEIYARLRADEPLEEIAEDLGNKFGAEGTGEMMRQLMKHWPRQHLEGVKRICEWALEKLYTDDRILITWDGTEVSPETVTRIELRDKELRIVFAHPPGSIPGAFANA